MSERLQKQKSNVNFTLLHAIWLIEGWTIEFTRNTSFIGSAERWRAPGSNSARWTRFYGSAQYFDWPHRYRTSARLNVNLQHILLLSASDKRKNSQRARFFDKQFGLNNFVDFSHRTVNLQNCQYVFYRTVSTKVSKSSIELMICP